LNRQIFYLRLHDFFIIAISNFYRFGMTACFEDNVIFLSQTLVHISGHTVKIAKRWHCSDRAVRDEGLEFPFALQGDVLADNLPELLKIDQTFCRKYRHQVLPCRFYHHHFGVTPSFHVLGLGDPLRGKSFRMTQNFVTDLVLIQTINQPFRHLHASLKISRVWANSISQPDHWSDWWPTLELIRTRIPRLEGRNKT